jgi:hypothetical protein
MLTFKDYVQWLRSKLDVIQDQGFYPEWPEFNAAPWIRARKIIHQRQPTPRYYPEV